MTFNDEIYYAVCSIWPSTSVRTFSQILGRSTGYWNSVKSQNLKISTGALMNLQNTLQMQIIITQHATMKKQMMELQHKIAQELARRFVEQVDADELVLEELVQLEKTNGQAHFSSCLPIPIIISGNDTYSVYS